MKTELPNFVHRKKFSDYFLFLDSEIIKNEIFSERLHWFSKNILGESMCFRVVIPTQYESLELDYDIKIPNSEKDPLNIFYKKTFNLEHNEVPSYFFDFSVNDYSNKWELYCSLSYELGILGCDKSIITNVVNILKPYDNTKLQAKLESIGSIFTTEMDKNLFISTLLENYSSL